MRQLAITSPSLAVRARGRPDLWECRHCGLPAGQDPANPPEPLAVPQFKTPMGYLLERRTEAECEALLAEALQRLRAASHSAARGHPVAGDGRAPPASPQVVAGSDIGRSRRVQNAGGVPGRLDSVPDATPARGPS